MRRNCLHRLRVLVVHLELFLLIRRVLHLAAHNRTLVKHQLPQRLAQVRVFAHPLGHNMPRAFKCLVHAPNAELCVHKAACKLRQCLCGRLLLPQVKRQRLQPLLTCNRRLGAPLWTIRKIKIFKFVFVERSFDARLQFIRQLALLGNRSKNRRAPLRQIAKIR